MTKQNTKIDLELSVRDLRQLAKTILKITSTSIFRRNGITTIVGDTIVINRVGREGQVTIKIVNHDLNIEV